MSEKSKHINKKHIAHLEQVRRQTKMIKWIFGSIIGIAVLVVLYGYLNSTILVPYKTVAIVNGDKINAEKFQATVKLQRVSSINTYQQYYQLAQQFGVQEPTTDSMFGSVLQENATLLTDTNAMGNFVIEKLIKEQLIEQEAANRGITVSDEQVQSMLNEAFNFFPNGIPTTVPTATPFSTNVPNPASFAIVTITPTATTAPTSTPEATAEAAVTPTATVEEPLPTEVVQPTPTAVDQAGYDELYQAKVDDFVSQIGMDEQGFRDLYYAYLLRDALLKDVTKDMTPFQDRVWARHILVGTEEEALAILDRLNAGEDFASIAADVSLDTSNKDNGGDLGWFAAGKMVAEFETAAFALGIGEVSQPVKTDFGYHIIQVIGHELQPISESEFTDAKNTAFEAFLQTLRDEADVEIFDVWQGIVPVEPAFQ